MNCSEDLKSLAVKIKLFSQKKKLTRVPLAAITSNMDQFTLPLLEYTGDTWQLYLGTTSGTLTDCFCSRITVFVLVTQ